MGADPLKATTPIHRRTFLQAGGSSALGLTLAQLAAARAAARTTLPGRGDLIRAENDKEGTTDWLLSHTRVDPKARYRSPWVEGYCSHTSLRAGEKLKLFVSTNPPSPFVIDLYRLGYYRGKGGRHVARLGPFKGAAQPEATVGKERLRECAWEAATAVEIPRDWPSGVYLGKLTAEKGKFQSYVVFIVRDGRACDFLFQCSDTTWCAYNRWPSTWSLYDDGTTDEKGGWSTRRWSLRARRGTSSLTPRPSGGGTASAPRPGTCAPRPTRTLPKDRTAGCSA